MKHASVVTFHVFFGKIPPLRGLFTNLRESIKEAKSINQPDAKPGIKKPRPNRQDIKSYLQLQTPTGNVRKAATLARSTPRSPSMGSSTWTWTWTNPGG